MKLDINRLYVVYKPSEHSEMLDVFDGQPVSLEGLFSQVRGGLTIDMVHAIYTTKNGAKRETEKIFKRERGVTENNKSIENRFQHFTKDLAELSSKYGIAIQSIGGVYFFDNPVRVTYREDHTSGDLDPSWEEE